MITMLEENYPLNYSERFTDLGQNKAFIEDTSAA